MRNILTSLAGFIIGMTITCIGFSCYNINTMQQDIKQLQAEKISGWGND